MRLLQPDRRFWIASVHCRKSRMRGTDDVQCLSDQNRVVGTVGFVECRVEINAMRSLQGIPDVFQLLAAIFLQGEYVRIFSCDQVVDNGIAPVAQVFETASSRMPALRRLYERKRIGGARDGRPENGDSRSPSLDASGRFVASGRSATWSAHCNA